jgi:hypothetical protein
MAREQYDFWDHCGEDELVLTREQEPRELIVAGRDIAKVSEADFRDYTRFLSIEVCTPSSAYAADQLHRNYRNGKVLIGFVGEKVNW